jgi:four helix bundle protein
MRYQRFEELPVWNDAVELSAQIFAFGKDRELRALGDAANQLERAGLSISNNIAEGFERGTTQELLTFIYYARGSAGDVRSILHVLNRVTSLGHLQSEICNLMSKAESISRQLRAWAGTLQNSDVTGTRYQIREEPRSPGSPPESRRLHDQAQDVNPSSEI